MGRWPIAADDGDFVPYARGPHADLFWRFIEMARSSGPVTFELQNGPVILRGTRRIFAGVSANRNGLTGFLMLFQPVEDPRIAAAHRQGQRLVHNHFRVATADALDATFAEWLGQARDIGDGAHLMS